MKKRAHCKRCVRGGCLAKVSERFDKAGCVGLQVKPQRWEWSYVDKGVSQRIYLKGTEKSEQGCC